MKHLLIIATLIGCMAFATSCKKSADAYAKEMVEITIEGLEAQLNGASMDDMVKIQDRAEKLEKEIQERTNDDPEFEKAISEAYQKQLLADPKFKELQEKAMQKMTSSMEMVQDIETLDLPDDIQETAEEIMEEVTD